MADLQKLSSMYYSELSGSYDVQNPWVRNLESPSEDISSWSIRPEKTRNLPARNQKTSLTFNPSRLFRLLFPGYIAPSESSLQPMDWTDFTDKLHEHAVGGGRFGDVYRGKWIQLSHLNEPLPSIAIKIIRSMASHQQDGRQRALRHLTREISVWHKLTHENIVPFVGVSYRFGPMPALISIWMENGTAREYVQDHPEANRFELTVGVARGLEYLHGQTPEIIHGDLKAVNILVDERGVPRLGDFGLSRMLCDETLWVTTSSSIQGSIRWMAPELLSGEQTSVNKATDIYAYSMTALEIMTGLLPFSQYAIDGALMVAIVMRKERPIRSEDPPISSLLWELWESCWAEDPNRRIPIQLVLSRLADIAATSVGRCVLCSSHIHVYQKYIPQGATWHPDGCQHMLCDNCDKRSERFDTSSSLDAVQDKTGIAQISKPGIPSFESGNDNSMWSPAKQRCYYCDSILSSQITSSEEVIVCGKCEPYEVGVFEPT